ncbi:FKBP-type peptidyl-prolyl cis-trans isomerase [Dermabacter sp. p3-SID358]|uniref:FKBP-type peptidyl-prolyl cis-trans isomerase n=1 Tax=Dermabacter sp. p3-SID358 TaxID=2916114 RepID=UPI0021A65FAF|nr:FKBP-type peptidyl-prolyl cis-trans isomerase [Dermabacter sp. p3-SID358]MCT1866052.1 FKBP-type peptidyl-prolyl cis-trans isomerase [Dermabacter sp. p3-SID358]
MINRRSLLAAAASISALVTLGACARSSSKDVQGVAQASDSGASEASDAGGDKSEDANVLDRVKVASGFGEDPSLEFDAPLEFSEFHSTVVGEGDGPAIAEGDFIVTRSAYFDPASGEVLASQWEEGTYSPFKVDQESVGETATEFFTGVKAHSRFLMAGVAGTQKQKVLQVGDVVGIALKRAEGASKDLPPEVPAYTLAEDGAPNLGGKPEGAAPEKMVVATAIEGAGPAAKKGDTLVMHYRGWDWESGEEFDSSWSRGAPFSFKLGDGQVIKGWDEGLEGAKQGSQVALILPPASAYGDAGQGNQNPLAGKTLLFVADVLYVASPEA